MLACTASSAAGAPSNPSHKYFLALPSPLAEEAGGGCCGEREEEPVRPVPEPGPVWNDGDLKILQLITCPSPGVNRWLSAPTARARKLLISSLQSSGSFAHPPTLIYAAAWAPYCQLRITVSLSPPKLLVQARCRCCQPLCSLLGRSLCRGGIFSLAKEGGQ